MGKESLKDAGVFSKGSGRVVAEKHETFRRL